MKPEEGVVVSPRSNLSVSTEKRIKEIIGDNKCCVCGKPAQRFRRIANKEETYYCFPCFDHELVKTIKVTEPEPQVQFFKSYFELDESKVSDHELLQALAIGKFHFRFIGFE